MVIESYIVIGKETETLTHTVRKVQCDVFKLFVMGSGGKGNILDANTIGSKVVFGIEKDSGSIDRLSITENLQTRICKIIAASNLTNTVPFLNYCKNRGGELYFDCESLVYFIYKKNRKVSMYSNREIKDFDEKEISVGDVIYIGSSSPPQLTRQFHYALYIGKGLYISKFGAHIDGIKVTTFSEMKKFYPYENIYTLRP